MARAEGKTFRMLLKVIARASENENNHQLIIFGSNGARDHAFNVAARMLHTSVGDYVEINQTARAIYLKNGSKIQFATTEYVKRGRWHAVNWTSFEEDNSLEFGGNDDEYRAHFSELLDYINKRKK